MRSKITIPSSLAAAALTYIEENSTLIWNSGISPTDHIDDLKGATGGIEIMRNGDRMMYLCVNESINTFNMLASFINGYER